MTQITKEYAEALFSLGAENNALDNFSDALGLVSSVFSENPEYLSVLSSPNIQTDEKASLIDDAFSDSLPDDVLVFLKVLCKNGDMKLLFPCIDEFKSLYKVSNSLSYVKITSAVNLSDEEKDALVKKLEKTYNVTVQPSYFVDPSLIAGIVIDMDGKIIDGSIKSNLDRIKEVITG
jgi:F-type H+-transporting ATPase subunit delta